MFELIGFLAVCLGMCWLTLLAFFGTVRTFSEALFAGNIWQKLLGVILWVLVLGAWYLVLSKVSISL